MGQAIASLAEDRYFDLEPGQKEIALELYQQVRDLPLVCPHGHVDPRMFSDPDYDFGTPVDLLIIPDHYVYRMLYSHGIALEKLGIPRLDDAVVERDHRKIWQIFAENFYLFWGTPTGIWLNEELRLVFGVESELNGEEAQDIYDQIAEKLTQPEFRPRKMFETFNIEVLCTTDAASDSLAHHQKIGESGWTGRILPTFRPDAVVNHIHKPGWRESIQALSAASDIDVQDYGGYIRALENRRAYFKQMGARATDHAALAAYTEALSSREVDRIFQRALQGEATEADAVRFTGHMLIEMARMSCEDGLVMQLHVGSERDHNLVHWQRFGPNTGADIPVTSEFTHNLQPLLEEFGRNSALTLILFTLDESTYARELAPLAGFYPALRVGPPWWFHDSFNGMRRYFDRMMETAGIYNTVGFNDDTRAFPSIPARHDLWRRASANWVAGLVARSIVTIQDAEAMVKDLAYGLAKRAYNLD
ncbi:MAG: glucuronate isomerase [Anaerolineales bacterium]|nr:glucuronate isomerase [Anaerolineales bacterium]